MVVARSKGVVRGEWFDAVINWATESAERAL